MPPRRERWPRAISSGRAQPRRLATFSSERREELRGSTRKAPTGKRRQVEAPIIDTALTLTLSCGAGQTSGLTAPGVLVNPSPLQGFEPGRASPLSSPDADHFALRDSLQARPQSAGRKPHRTAHGRDGRGDRARYRWRLRPRRASGEPAWLGPADVRRRADGAPEFYLSGATLGGVAPSSALPMMPFAFRTAGRCSPRSTARSAA